MKKKVYIDYLNVLAAMSVVFLHTNGVFWEYSEDKYWFSANIIESVFYFGVPVFFMITGATLLDYRKRYDTKTFFRKRAWKVLIPYTFWSLVGLVYVNRGFSQISFGSIVEHLVNSNAIAIYWFFVPLFQVYLMIPLLSAVPDNQKKSIYTYIAVGGFIINSVIPFLISVFQIQLYFPLHFVAATDYLLLVVIGYLISHYEIPKKYRYAIYLLGAAGLFMHIIGTYTLSRAAGQIVHVYKGYCNVPCVMYSTAVFLFFVQLNDKLVALKINKLIQFLRNYTFALYLMQFYFENALDLIFKLNIYSIVYRLCMPFVILACCVIAANIIRKLPFGKIILP